MIPPLPPHTGARQRSPNIYAAWEILSDVAQDVRTALEGQGDVTRIHFHADRIMEEAIPILLAFEDLPEREQVPSSWLEKCSDYFGDLISRLSDAEMTAKGEYVPLYMSISETLITFRETSNVAVPELVKIVRTPGKRGRPRKVPNIEIVREAMAPGQLINVKELASTMKMHRNTLTPYLKNNNIDYKYSTMTDDELDTLVDAYRQEYPASGSRYVRGHLRALGHRIQEQRVRDSIKRVDPLGGVLRENKAIKRKKYKVARPDALWHMDGHHKLIRWAIVIHGIVDGYSRMVTAFHYGAPSKILICQNFTRLSLSKLARTTKRRLSSRFLKMRLKNMG